MTLLARCLHRLPHPRAWVAALVLALAAAPALSMTVEVVGARLFATGPVVDDDILRFETALRDPAVTTVVLLNSPGGDLWNGMRIGRLIAERRLDTVAAGACVSSCSIMFMGGRERRFSDAFRPGQTYIGFHGPHDRNTKSVIPQQATQMYAFLRQQMGARFNADAVQRMLYDMEDAGALMRVFDVARKPSRVTYHCRSSQTPRAACTELKDLDALNLGVVTSAELVSLELPASMLAAPSVWGQTLGEPVADLPARVAALAARYCQADACRKLFDGYAGLREHRALAVPTDGAGVATLANRDTAHLAALGAIHACNHVKDRPPRLCELQLIDSSEFGAYYAQAGAEHAAARARLAAPAERFFASEEFGGAFAAGRAPRTQKLADTTPATLEGVVTVGTQELVRLLVSARAPLAIDVMGLEPTLPGAAVLAFGGFAFDDAQKERTYHERFVGLLALLAPDRAQPIVFVGTSRNHWHAANAALRARQAGYTAVSWYRGGMESWKAAQLPTAAPLIRAVVN